MIENWRNALCSCDSGKKYKKCYWVQDGQNTCIQYLRENNQEKIIYLQQFVNEGAKEVSDAIEVLILQWKTQVRCQCIILFAFLEALVQMWSKFTDLQGSDADIYQIWFEIFILNASNLDYYNNTSLYWLDWRKLHALRSELSHSFALPNNGICIVNDVNHPYSHTFKAKGCIVFTPWVLWTAIFRGWELMITKMQSVKDIDELAYLLWIKRIYWATKKAWAVVFRD